MNSDTTEILFISDLHLSAERPAMIELFNQFVHKRAIHSKALYILGDFFEYWLGDDDPANDLKSVFNAFHFLYSENIPVYFMHGNRDFLADSGFAERTYCQIIQDPTTITINDTDIILMHGDSLCTEDIKYQDFKKQVRSEEWKKEFLSKPLSERKAIVESLRKSSASETAQKNEQIMDVNKDAVMKTFQQSQCQWLIHGHTHRPDVHYYADNKQTLTRIVLGDWFNQGSVLSVKYQNSTAGFKYVLESFH